MVRRSIIVVILVTGIFFLAGCAPERYGQAIPNNLEVIKVKKIFENSNQYKGQLVVVTGKMTGIHTGGREFYLIDDGSAVEIVSSNKCPMPSESQIQSVVKVYGKVIEEKSTEREEEKEIKIEAIGLKFE